MPTIRRSPLQDLDGAGVCRLARGWRRNGEKAVVKIPKLILAAAAFAVLAGNKGSCNLNPAGPGPQAATPAAPRKKHHARR
jgi:hypothetical protein